MTDSGLVYIGKIIELDPIEGADLILSATVVCGMGGKWKGVVRKEEFSVGDMCTVFLPDSLLPETDDFRFMEKHKWRVKMCRFRGVPSEVLIMGKTGVLGHVGRDITETMAVKRYCKPVAVNLQGIAKGDFPSFIPKTDEHNYQSADGMESIMRLTRKPYYITEKADGSSTTAYRYKGNFGVCSRNYDLERDESNGYWEIAIRHNLEETLPEGIALQWETCGPKIQGNPMGFPKVTGLAFSAYNIVEERYLNFKELVKLCEDLKFPMVNVLDEGDRFLPDGIEQLGEGTYANGKQREGVVVRSKKNCRGFCSTIPISFKVINLNYEN